MTWKNFFQKITRDILIALLITYFFLLLPEIVLPGIVSVHFSPKYFLALILLLSWTHLRLFEKNSPPENNVRFRSISKNILNAILFVIAAMLVLSLYKMKIWEIALITVFSMGLFITMKKMLIEEEG